jgi:hypothetical protein
MDYSARATIQGLEGVLDVIWSAPTIHRLGPQRTPGHLLTEVTISLDRPAGQGCSAGSGGHHGSVMLE